MAILRVDATGAETTWTEGVDYTLTGAGVEAGGELTATAAPATGETLVILRQPPETQGTDLPLGGALSSDNLEAQLDYLTMLVQAHSEEIARALLLKATTPTTGLVIPEPEADKFLGWNSAGDNLENKASAGGGVTDHGALTGLADDDHTQYLLVAGTRAMTGALDMGGQNITTVGTVDGRDVSADGTKLDGVEANATADQTAAEIKTAYESNANTNAFTDAEQSKLAGIETGAEVNDVTSVFGRTGAVVAANGDVDNITINMQDKELTRPKVKDYELTKNSRGSITGAQTIDVSLGNFAEATITGNTTFSFSNWPAGYGQVDMLLTSDGTGGHTLTFTGVTFATSAPANMTANQRVRVVVESPDGGTTKYGYLIAEAF